MSREMKDSGIEWIGQIPKEWEIRRIKSIFSERTELSENGDETLLSVSEYYGVASRKEKIEEGEYVSRAESLVGYKKCFKGDLVSNIMLAWKGSLGVTDTDGIVSPAYCVYMPSKEIFPYYYHYLFRTSLFTSVFRLYSKGIIDSRLRLYSPFFFTISTLFPPYIEQQKIADYLDKVCGEVDEVVALQEKMIEELKAYKQSVITEAVTKGLNPNVPMKDSGIDWIGRIPEHWEIIQTKRIVLNHLQGYYDPDGYVLSGYRLLRITDLLSNGNLSLINAPYVKETPNIKEFILQRGDFCFARTGGAGSFGFVSEDIEPAVFASYLIRFRFSGQNKNYLRYYFLSNSFISEVNSLIHGGVNKNIHAENIKETHLPIPSISEQQQIASFLDTKCTEIDALIAIKQAKIEELKEYKKSVIYEYVTGKKEVI